MLDVPLLRREKLAMHVSQTTDLFLGHDIRLIKICIVHPGAVRPVSSTFEVLDQFVVPAVRRQPGSGDGVELAVTGKSLSDRITARSGSMGRVVGPHVIAEMEYTI